MTTPSPGFRPRKRPLSTISCSSSIYSDSDSSDDSPPHKKLAKSLTRLSLSSTPNPEPKDAEMRQRKSYERDAFTTVIESLSTSSSDSNAEEDEMKGEAPFPRDEAHVTILSEIEKRLTQFPHKLLAPVNKDTALVLWKSPESMGLPRLERQKQEDLKAEVRKRIAERRRQDAEAMARRREEMDGYEADAEDWDEVPVRHSMPTKLVNGAGEHHDVGQNVDNGLDEDEGDMMDLD